VNDPPSFFLVVAGLLAGFVVFDLLLLFALRVVSPGCLVAAFLVGLLVIFSVVAAIEN